MVLLVSLILRYPESRSTPPTNVVISMASTLADRSLIDRYPVYPVMVDKMQGYPLAYPMIKNSMSMYFKPVNCANGVLQQHPCIQQNW